MNKKENMDSPLRLLLIDDNPDDRVLILRELKKEFEIQVQEIIDAEGLASALKRGDFDIAITDYQLKWSNGLEILGKIKARYPDCSVIMFTGTGNEEIAVEAMKDGLDDYVIKSPKHFKRLPAAIKAAMQQARQRQTIRETQEALRKYEQDKALILDAMSEHVVYRDKKMRVLWVNRAAGESVGFAPEQLVGRYCYEIWHQRSTPCAVCPAKETLKTGQQKEMEVTTPDGRIWWIRTYPVRDTNGDIVGIANVTLEITERKQAEEALSYSKDKLQILQQITATVHSTLARQAKLGASCRVKVPVG
jgi:PAS domain S-box-containing protein